MVELGPWAAEKANWIIVDLDDYAFVCLRCGSSDLFDIPIRSHAGWEAWVHQSQHFCAIHRVCRVSVDTVHVQESLL